MLSLSNLDSPETWLAEPFCNLTKLMPHGSCFVGGGCITKYLLSRSVEGLKADLYLRDRAKFNEVQMGLKVSQYEEFGKFGTLYRLNPSVNDSHPDAIPMVQIHNTYSYPELETFLNKQLFTIETVAVFDQQVIYCENYFYDCARRFVDINPQCKVYEKRSAMLRAIDYTKDGFLISGQAFCKLYDDTEKYQNRDEVIANINDDIANAIGRLEKGVDDGLRINKSG